MGGHHHPHGRLMLTVLGGLAEFERELIRARTGEGRARAKARGVKLGRKPKLTPHQQREAIKRRDSRAKRCATSRAATTSATARFRGFQHDGKEHGKPGIAYGRSQAPCRESSPQTAARDERT